MVVTKVRGEDQIRRYLQFELDRYLEGRASGSQEPLPEAQPPQADPIRNDPRFGELLRKTKPAGHGWLANAEVV
jgi:hypothetical protein